MKLGSNEINHILTREGLVDSYKIILYRNNYKYKDHERSSFNTRIFSLNRKVLFSKTIEKVVSEFILTRLNKGKSKSF